MTSKLERLRSLSEQLPRNNEDTSEWEWHSFLSLKGSLIDEGIFKRYPPTNNHLRELMRLAIGEPMKAPRSVAARWAKRTAIQLSHEAHAA